jgi:hypothetical protein
MTCKGICYQMRQMIFLNTSFASHKYIKCIIIFIINNTYTNMNNENLLLSSHPIFSSLSSNFLCCFHQRWLIKYTKLIYQYYMYLILLAIVTKYC